MRKNVITAFIACDNSHRQRSCSQSGGIWVQLLVARLAGNVKAQKITSVATKTESADQREDRGARWSRMSNASARFAIAAPIKTIPSNAQPGPALLLPPTRP